MSSKKEKFARFGIATKGLVYILIGGLTALAAFGRGGQTTDSSGVLAFLGSQAYGKVLLIVTAIGLTGYVFFRFYQAIKDPEARGTGTRGIVIRLGYAGSGVFYGLLAFSAISTVMGSGSSGKSNESMIGMLLSKPFGQVLVGLVAVILFGKALYQFYKAYSGKHGEQVTASGLDSRTRNMVFKAGKIGYTSRGLVIGIVAVLTFRAAFTANSGAGGGTKEAFSLMQNEFGSVVLGIIALGLLVYGMFMLVKARYKRMDID